MRTHMSTMVLMAALVAVAFMSLPSDARAQYGDYDGVGYGYDDGHGYGAYGPFGYEDYQLKYGDVRIEVGPKSLRDEAQVYLNQAHVGDVNDFDGFFQRLTLTPGTYDVEIRLDGYQTLKKRIVVERGSANKIRESLKPVVSNVTVPGYRIAAVR